MTQTIKYIQEIYLETIKLIIFKNIEQSKPFLDLYNYYVQAQNAKQESIEALLIASYSLKKNEVDARYVNLKVVEGNKFIFFSNEIIFL